LLYSGLSGKESEKIRYAIRARFAIIAADSAQPRKAPEAVIEGEVQVAKIYVSSTYNDLKECREAVYRALRALRHDVIAMEDYVASDQRPLDKCLADVAACEIYVGVFAWRYGFVPDKNNTERKSITELEYRQAVKTGKRRLIFLVDENAELKPLDDAWANPSTNIVTFVAWGGVGKSALVNRWLRRMANDNYRGAERVYGRSFYSQGAGDDRAASADLFIKVENALQLEQSRSV